MHVDPIGGLLGAGQEQVAGAESGCKGERHAGSLTGRRPSTLLTPMLRMPSGGRKEKREAKCAADWKTGPHW